MSLPFKTSFHSLPFKLTISIIFWLVGAISFTGLTLNLSWALEDGGAAINAAGSLRKTVYHMVALAGQPNHEPAIRKELANFESTLVNLERGKNASIIGQQVSSIRDEANQIASGLIASSTPENIKVQLHRAESSIDRINVLVKSIETENTKNIRLLRFCQAILIGMVILSAFVAVFWLRVLVVRPLNKLNNGILKIHQGDLLARVTLPQNDEFGQISEGFNRMAASLADLYDNLEQKVKEQTLALEDKNRELTQLYEITAFLHESHTRENMTQGFLNQIMSLCQAQAGSVRLLSKSNKNIEYICSIGLPDELVGSEQCQSVDDCYCGRAVWKPDIMIYSLDQLEKDKCIYTQFDHFIVFHIRHNEHDFGILTLYFQEDEALEPQIFRLVETMCNQFGISIENQRLALGEQQLAVLEERNFMAQGLHDSIAQSLSFLNLQVQMMQDAMDKENFARANENLRFIQEGVKECYEEVRELLLNFRVKMVQERFPDAVRSVISRFEKQTGITVQANMPDDDPDLNPKEQLQVVFILQEALSNVRKHSQATQVDVTMSNQNGFTISIKDNGIGFDYEKLQAKIDRHVGMTIMKERASRIHASITIHSEINKGTEVILLLEKEKRDQS